MLGMPWTAHIARQDKRLWQAVTKVWQPNPYFSIRTSRLQVHVQLLILYVAFSTRAFLRAAHMDHSLVEMMHITQQNDAKLNSSE